MHSGCMEYEARKGSTPDGANKEGHVTFLPACNSLFFCSVTIFARYLAINIEASFTMENIVLRSCNLFEDSLALTKDVKNKIKWQGSQGKHRRKIQ